MTATASQAPARSALAVLPVGLFGAVMGLIGLSVAWRLAQQRYGGPDWLAMVSPALGALAIATFVAVLAGYAFKLATAFEAVKAEFQHPVAGNPFGAPLISLLLLPIPLAPYSLALARTCWTLGAVGMVLFASFVVNRWMSERQQAAHATPAWIIPVVGLLDVPLAVPNLNLPPMHALMVFSLGVGLFFRRAAVHPDFRAAPIRAAAG